MGDLFILRRQVMILNYATDAIRNVANRLLIPVSD